jgi:hypothetical protein
MRTRLALVVATGCLGLGLGLTAAEPASSRPAHSCSSRYTHAVLSWGHKCLAVGQFCTSSADREYHRYRFHCHKRDGSGRYRLTR